MAGNSITAKTSAVLVEQERDKILSEANNEFIDLYEKIRESLIVEEQNTIRSRYDIGVALEAARQNESKYGSKFVERMEIAIGYDKSVIYNALVFAQRFTEEEVNELLDRRDKHGNSLLWTHVVHVMRAPDRATRKELLDLTFKHGFSPTELLTFIQKRSNRPAGPRSNAGKPLARPKSLQGFIDQQSEMVQQLLRRKAKVWAGAEKAGDKSFIDILLESPIDKMKATTLAELTQLTTLYNVAAQEMIDMAAKIAAAKEEIADKIDGYDPADDDDDETQETNLESSDGINGLLEDTDSLTEEQILSKPVDEPPSAADLEEASELAKEIEQEIMAEAVPATTTPKTQTTTVRRSPLTRSRPIL